MSLTAFVLSALAIVALAQESRSWRDPSAHRAQFVAVEDGVRLEVLDWKGSGRPIVLLAGSGNTAHVFDGFAEKLTGLGRVRHHPARLRRFDSSRVGLRRPEAG